MCLLRHGTGHLIVLFTVSWELAGHRREKINKGRKADGTKDNMRCVLFY
jgi:hypothetical protein